MTLNNNIVLEYPTPACSSNVQPFIEKMVAAGLDERVINGFAHYYAQLEAGATGFISGDEARPVETLPTYHSLGHRYHAEGIAHLDKLVVLKLNGGLGTGMGMKGPKSLVTVRDGQSFLDITVGQIDYLRRKHDVRVPLVLMNSFNTAHATDEALKKHPQFAQDVRSGFVQNRFPKIWKSDLSVAEWPAAPNLEWNPPGHGDLYAAIVAGGILEELLEHGYEYMFVSNIDNLGATFDPKILGYFAAEEIPFLMEVAERTPADSKGGHLAQRADGQLILRESAQCPPDETEAFQDISIYSHFNTNNLWIHLPTLERVSHNRNGVLGLSLIRNQKPIDPTRPDTPPVYQLETAMGSAIEVFEGARALQVPRNRFLPVKRNDDLLVLMSDAYTQADDFTLRLASSRSQAPLVAMDCDYFRLIDDMDVRFPYGAPSMVACDSLRIVGDVRFGRDVTLSGDVVIENPSATPMQIADGSEISGLVSKGERK